MREAFFKFTIHQGDRKIRRRPYRSPSLLPLPPGGGVRGAAEVVAGVPELVQRVEELPQPRPGAGVAGLPRLGPRRGRPRGVEPPREPPQLVRRRVGVAAGLRGERLRRARGGRQRRRGDHGNAGRRGALVDREASGVGAEETRACWRPRRFNLKSTAAKIGSWLSSAYASKQRLFPDFFYFIFFGRRNR